MDRWSYEHYSQDGDNTSTASYVIGQPYDYPISLQHYDAVECYSPEPFATEHPYQVPAPAQSMLPPGPPRRQVRTSNACTQCRSKKRKCDGGMPCGACQLNHVICRYQPQVLSKTGRMEQMESKMEQMMIISQELKSEVANLQMTMENVDQRLTQIMQCLTSPSTPNKSLRGSSRTSMEPCSRCANMGMMYQNPQCIRCIGLAQEKLEDFPRPD